MRERRRLVISVVLSMTIGFKVVSCTKENCNFDRNLKKYDDTSCKVHWNCTVEKLLKHWLERKQLIDRTLLSTINVSNIGHTPMIHSFFLRNVTYNYNCFLRLFVKKMGVRPKQHFFSLPYGLISQSK